jgi:uncharacterized protein YndB with AHSA1/START domain
METFERSIDLDAPASEVWEAVSDPSRLAGWLGEEVQLDVVEGGSGRVVDDGVVRRVRVDEVDTGRKLSFTWWPEDDATGVSRVELIVVSRPGGSRLVVHEFQARAANRWELRLCLAAFAVEVVRV